MGLAGFDLKIDGAARFALPVPVPSDAIFVVGDEVFAALVGGLVLLVQLADVVHVD